MIKKTLILLISALLFITHSSPLFAQELTELAIQDSSGVTRAVSQIDKMGNIEFQLVDSVGEAAKGVEVSLTNAATGETINAVAANGTVLFDGISPGVWTVTSTAKDVTFTNVAISSSAALAPVGAAAVSGLSGLGISSGAAAGGVAAVGAGGVAISEANKSSKKSPLSPSS